jgi:hypothetical protein
MFSAHHARRELLSLPHGHEANHPAGAVSRRREASARCGELPDTFHVYPDLKRRPFQGRKRVGADRRKAQQM